MLKYDIYDYLKSGGKIEDLQKAFYADIQKAQDRIEKEKVLEAEKKVREQKKLELKDKAVAALMEYVKFCGTAQTKEHGGYTEEDFSTLVDVIGATDIMQDDPWLLNAITSIFNI